MDAQSGLAELPRLGREFDNVGSSAEQASARATRSLGALNASMHSTTAAMDRVGVSTGQTNAALRQMPAQLTDIFTSLAGGQSPMLVLIQQGGQIKDAFGGVGETFRALGGQAALMFPTLAAALSGTVAQQQAVAETAGDAAAGLGDMAAGANDTTEAAQHLRVGLTAAQHSAAAASSTFLLVAAGVAAAAVAATTLVIAYRKGAAESFEFEKALLKTGNILGTTTGQLREMAQAIGAGDFTEGAAASALAALASSGRVAGESLEEFTQIALEMEEYVGQAVADTSKIFEELGKEPTKAVLKLNESLHFLSLTQLEQIRTLEEQGDKTRAAQVAQEAYAESTKKSIKVYKANLDRLDIAVNYWTDKGKSMWDALLGVGRQQTGQDRIAALKTQLASLNGPTPLQNVGLLDALKGAVNFYPTVDRLKASTQAQITYLERVTKAAQDSAKYESARQKMQEAGIAASTAVTRVNTAAQSKQVQLNNALDDYRKNIAAIKAANPNSELLDPKKIATAEAGIREQYKETARVQRQAAITGESEVASIRARVIETQSYIDSLKVQGLAAAKMNEGEALTINLQKQLEGSLKGVARANKEKALVAAQALGAALQERAVIEELLKAQENLLALRQREIDTQESAILKMEEKAQEVEDEVAMYGIGKEAIEALTIARLEEKKAMLMQFDGSAEQVALIEKEIGARQRLAVAIDTKSSLEAGEKAARKTAEEWQKSTDQINQSLTDAIMAGGKSGADYLKNLFKTMVLRPIISAVMSPVAGAVNGVINSGMSALGLSGGAGSVGSSMLSNMATSALGSITLGGSTIAAIGSSVATGVSAGLAGTSLAGATAAYSAAGMSGVATGLSVGSSIGAAMAAIPGWGWAAMAAVAAAAVLQGGETRNGATYDTVNGKAHYQQGPSGGEIAGSDARNMFDLAQSGINDMLKAVGSKAVLSGFTAGLESSKNGKGFNFAGGYIDGVGFGESKGRDGGQFSMRSQNSQEALTNYATELKQATVQALQTATDIPKTIAEMLAGVNANALASADVDALLSSISGVVSTVNGFHDAMLLLPFEQLKDLSFDAAAGLIKAAGGLDALSSNLSTYYDNFYSDAERRAQAIKNINAATAGSGLDAATATRASYRSLLESQDVTTESGQAMYSALLAIAPALATLADQTSQFAQDTASKLLETFSARQQLVPLLTVTLNGFDALGAGLADAAGQALDMSSATGWINTLLGQASSGVLYFGDQVQGLDQPLNGAQLAADALADQVLALKLGANSASTDIAGLSAALADVDTATFVATMQGLLKKVGDMFGDVLGSISNERIAVREAALSIINPAIMSKEQILRGIAGANVRLPGNAEMVSGQANLSMRDAAVAAAVAAVSSVKSSSPSTAALDSAAAVLAAANARVASAQAGVDTYRAYGNSKFNHFMDQAYAGVDLRGTVPNPSGERNAQNVVFESLAANAAQQPAQSAYSAQLALYDQQFAAYSVTLAAAQAQLDAATAQQTQALDAAKSAQLAYIDSLQNYAIDASKATAKLSDLREETVKYYQQQKALADLMTQSAGALRKTVADYRYSLATPEQQYAQLQTQFNTAYSMALSTSGETLAGYGDKLSSLVNPLLEKAQETGMSNSAYSALVNTVLARADATAARIDQLTPTNYAADSLAMLGQIDSTLFALEEGSKSAERVITDAINLGRDQTVNGLRQVVNALTGTSVSYFASGGAFTNGIATGPTAFNMGVMGEAGSEGILPLANVGGRLGVHATGGGSVARLEALVERQNQQMEGLRADLRSALAVIANGTSKTAKILDRQETDGVLVRTSSDQPLEMVAV